MSIHNNRFGEISTAFFFFLLFLYYLGFEMNIRKIIWCWAPAADDFDIQCFQLLSTPCSLWAQPSFF